MKVDYTKWLAICLTAAGMLVGAAFYISNSHADIKSWTAEKDYATKVEIKEDIKERYVPLKDFTRIEEKVDNLKELLLRWMEQENRKNE